MNNFELKFREEYRGCSQVEAYKKIHTIEKPTKEEAYREYFQEWSNRYRYHNGKHVSILDKDQHQEYCDWLFGRKGGEWEGQNNYAKSGGDMW
jgi:hypothetical protein